MNIKLLLDLFLTFFKIGGLTIGGGLAMIPFIQNQIVDKKGWVNDTEMTDFLVIGQSLPGVISINCATAIGNKLAGKTGAFAATAGVVAPSLIIIMAIASFFDEFLEFEIIQNAFNGMRGAVVALIAAAVIKLGKENIKSYFDAIIGVLTITGILFFNISPPYMLLLAATISLIYKHRCKTGGDKS